MNKWLATTALAVACSTAPAYALESFSVPYVSKAGPYSGQAAMIPEPSTYALMLGGLVAAWLARRRLAPPGALAGLNDDRA